MVNPWLAITFQAVRLGLEAQNAMALRLMRLAGDASKTEAHGMIADKIAAAPEQAAATKVVPESAKRSTSECARTCAGALSNVPLVTRLLDRPPLPQAGLAPRRVFLFAFVGRHGGTKSGVTRQHDPFDDGTSSLF
jgi:hypothetical protein